MQPYPGLEACAPPDSDVGAGCLGDYPMIGIDQHALWYAHGPPQSNPDAGHAVRM